MPAIDILKVRNVSVLQYLKDKSLKIDLKMGGQSTAFFSLINCEKININNEDFFIAPGQIVEINSNFKGIINRIIKRIIKIDYDTENNILNEFFELDIEIIGFSNIPMRRTIYGRWDNCTCGDIVLELQQNFLSSEGITVGYIDSGKTLDAQIGYDADIAKSIKDIFNELAEMSGYIWYIDNDLKLYFVEGYPTFEYTKEISKYSFCENTPNDTLKIMSNSFQLEKTGENYINKCFVIGGVDDDGYTVKGSYDATLAISAKQNSDGYGTGHYGKVLINEHAYTEAEANSLAEQETEENCHYSNIVRFTILNQDFIKYAEIGGIFYIYDIPNLAGGYRIEEMHISQFGNELKAEILGKSSKNVKMYKNSFENYFENKFKKTIKNEKNIFEIISNKIKKQINAVDLYDTAMSIKHRDNTYSNYTLTKDSNGNIEKITDINTGKEIIINWNEE